MQRNGESIFLFHFDYDLRFHAFLVLKSVEYCINCSRQTTSLLSATGQSSLQSRHSFRFPHSRGGKLVANNSFSGYIANWRIWDRHSAQRSTEQDGCYLTPFYYPSYTDWKRASLLLPIRGFILVRGPCWAGVGMCNVVCDEARAARQKNVGGKSLGCCSE